MTDRYITKEMITATIKSALEEHIDCNVFPGETTTGSTKLAVTCVDGNRYNITITKARD